MQLSYSGKETVSAPPAVVWAFMQHPEKVARCLPGVQDVQVVGPNQLSAAVSLGSGLLKTKIKLNITVEPNADDQTLSVVVRGGGMGSQIQLHASAKVLDEGNGTTALDWKGQADLSGPVANMGKMIESQAEAMVGRTFQNMSATIRQEQKLA